MLKFEAKKEILQKCGKNRESYPQPPPGSAAHACGAIFFPKFCALILKFSYIFSNFANGNFSTFETIRLIFYSTSYVQRRSLDDFPAKYYPALEFFFKIDILP